MIGAKWQMQDLSDKHEKKDAETTQTYKLKRRLNSVLSDPQWSHLLSRERNRTRRAVPFTADSESDALTESVSMGHTASMSFSIINQKLVSSERDIVILKQIHAGKNWHVFCFQSVNADPSQRSQQPDSWESPNLHCLDSASCFCRTTIQDNIRLKHHCLKQFRIKTPCSSQIKRSRSIFTSFARSFRMSFRTLSPEMIASATDETRWIFRFAFHLALSFVLTTGRRIGRREETTAILFCWRHRWPSLSQGSIRLSHGYLSLLDTFGRRRIIWSQSQNLTLLRKNIFSTRWGFRIRPVFRPVHHVRFRNWRVQHTTPPDGLNRIERPSHLQLRCISRDAVCNLLNMPFSVGFCKMNCAALSKTLASSVSFTEVLVVPSTAQLRHDCCVLRVVSSSSQNHLSLFSRETCILEKSISPNFQLKESLTSLFLSPRCLYKRVFVFDHFVFSLRADRGVDRGGSMVVTSYSRFLTSGVPVTSESLGHFAESTLLSHDTVSDDFSWSSSNLIIRLYFLVGVRHRPGCERAFLQETKEALNSSCIFKVLRFAHSNHFFRRSLQIGPQTSHCTFLFTRFQASS